MISVTAPHPTIRKAARTSPGAALLVLSATLSACGARGEEREASAAIVNGHAPTAAEVHGVVALVDATDGTVLCTGALVAPAVVVTAAHCLTRYVAGDALAGDDGRPMLAVVAGAATTRDATSEERYAVARLVLHPQFPGAPSADPSSLGADNDVGLLVLARPVTTDEPVSILPPPELDAAIDAGAVLTIAGFGVTDPSALTSRGTLLVGSVNVVRRTEHELLARSADGVDTCFGDSGGPAFVRDTSGLLRLVGITSREAADSPDDCGGGTVFSLAPSYAGFFEVASSVDLVAGVDPDPPLRPRHPTAGCDVASGTAHPGPTFLLAVAILLRRRRRRRTFCGE